jgi:hypothetical protein
MSLSPFDKYTMEMVGAGAEAKAGGEAKIFWSNLRFLSALKNLNFFVGNLRWKMVRDGAGSKAGGEAEIFLVKLKVLVSIKKFDFFLLEIYVGKWSEPELDQKPEPAPHSRRALRTRQRVRIRLLLVQSPERSQKK